MDSFDDLFSASFRRVLGDGAYNPALIGDFYSHFLASSEDVAARFANTDMSRQKTMMHDSLLMLVDFNRRRAVTPQMSHLAAVHGREGQDIPRALYDLWLDSLMSAVREHDSGFNSDVELAWRMTLAPGIAYMKFRNRPAAEH